MPTSDELLSQVDAQSADWSAVAPQFGRLFPNEDQDYLRQRYTANRMLGGVNAESAPWDHVAAPMERLFPDLSQVDLQQRYDDRRLMGVARQRYAEYDESWPTYLARRAAPFASTIAAAKMSMEYNAARQRIAAGQGRQDRSSWSDWLLNLSSPTHFLTNTTARNDYELVAEYERLQQIDQQRGTAQHIGSALANIPAIAGEAYAGGLALRGLGIGARAAAASPSLLSTEGLANLFTREGARAAAGATPAWVGRMAAQTAVMPSMWLTTAAQRAAQGPANQQWYSPSNLVPSFALGLTQTAVLGSLGHIANGIYGGGVKQIAARLGARVGLGMAEQQALDVITSAASEVLPQAWKVNTGYGILGHALHGDWGEAWKHTAVQLATFAAFSTMHEIQEGPPISPRDRMQAQVTQLNLNPAAAENVMGAFETYTAALKKAGVGREGAAKKAQQVFDAFTHEINDRPGMSREDAARRMADMFKSGPESEFGQALAQTMPPRQGPEPPAGFGPRQTVELPPAWGRQGPELPQGMVPRQTVERPPPGWVPRQGPPLPPGAGRMQTVEPPPPSWMRPSQRPEPGRSQVPPENIQHYQAMVEQLMRGGMRADKAQEQAAAIFGVSTQAEKAAEPPPTPAGYNEMVAQLVAAGRTREQAQQEAAALLSMTTKGQKAKKQQPPEKPPEGPAPEPAKPKGLAPKPAAPAPKQPPPPKPAERAEARREPQHLKDLEQQVIKEYPDANLEGIRQNVRDAGSIETAANRYPHPDSGVMGIYAREYARFHFSPKEKAFRGEQAAQAAESPERAAAIRKATIEAHIENTKLSKIERYVATEHFANGRGAADIANDSYWMKQYGAKTTPQKVSQIIGDAQAKLKMTAGKFGTMREYAGIKASEMASAQQFSPLSTTDKRRLESATTMSEKLRVAANADVNVLDPLYGSKEWKEGGFVTNEALRQLEVRYEMLKREGAGPARVNEVMDATKKLIKDTADKLRKIGKSQEASWYEGTGVDLLNEARRDLGGKEGGGASFFKSGEAQTAEERLGGAPEAKAATKEKAVGPFEWIRSALTMFGLHRYIGKVSENADAAYLEHVRAMEAGGMQAGDVPLTIHEIAHHLLREHDIEVNPERLPDDVRAGLKQLDYNQQRPEGKQAMREGFAEYLRIRETNVPFMERFTPEMKAAAKWAEGWLKEKGLTGKLDRLRDQYTAFAQQNPVERMQGNVSATGEPAKPTGLTPGERAGLHAATGWEAFLTQFVDRFHVFDMLEKERQRIGLAPMPKGQDLRSVFANTHFMGATWADEMAAKGIFTFERTANGTWRKATIGKNIDWIVEGFKPEDLQTKSNGTSRLGAFLLSNHIVGEVGRSKETVASKEQIQTAREVLAYEKKNDPRFYEQAMEAARRYTKIGEWMLDARVAMGMMKSEYADRLKKEHPDFVSLLRVMEDTSYEPAGIMARAGSGRQFIDPMVTLRGAMEHLAQGMTRQIKDYAVWEGGRQPEGPRGVSSFWKETDRPMKMEEINRTGLDQILESLGYDQMERQMLLDQHGVNALEYIQPTTKKEGHLLYPMMIDGEQKIIEVGNRVFYDALTQQQSKEGIASYAAKLAALPGLAQATGAMKAGATSASLIFGVRNIFRDAWHFWQNAEGTAVEKLGKLLAGHMEAARESAKQVFGMEPDVFWKLYKGSSAEDLRAFHFAPRGEGEAAWRRATGTAGPAKEQAIWAVNKVKDLMEFMGFGEHGPRFAEFKSALQEMGYTREKIQKALEASPHDSPIPLDVQVYARQRAANATTDFSRQGAFIHEWNKVVPFVGPHIAGLAQEAKNWNAAAAELRSGKMGPKAKAMIGALGVYLGAEIMHWLTFQGEDWYKEQPANQRYGWWILGKTDAGGVWGIPKPQGVMRMVGAFFQELLRTESASNPRLGMAAQDVGLQQSLPRALPLGGSEAVQLASNTSWMGLPIVPRQEEKRLTDQEKWLSYRLPYLIEQLSGGLAGQRTVLTLTRPTAALEASQVMPHQSVQDWHDALNDMEQRRTAARSRGLQFPDERSYQALHSIQDRMARLSAELRGERRVGGTLRVGEAPSDQRKIEIRAEQLRLARQALERAR